MRKAEIIGAIVFALFSIYLMWKSGEVASWDTAGRFSNLWFNEYGEPETGFWPFALSVIMFICCIWIGVNWWRRTSPPSRSTDIFLDRFGINMLITVVGGVVAFVALSSIISMYFAMTLFLIYYIGVLGRNRWVTTLSVALGAPVVTFLFFEWQMRIVLPKGYAEPVFLPLYDIFLNTGAS